MHEKAAAKERPVAKGVQARKSHVTRAYHQRNEEIEERRRHRHGDHEDHSSAVHGEELIVRIGIEELTLGCGKLNPNEQCFESGNKKVHKGRDKIKHADALVVYGGDPTPDHRPSGDAFLRADAS